MWLRLYEGEVCVFVCVPWPLPSPLVTITAPAALHVSGAEVQPLKPAELWGWWWWQQGGGEAWEYTPHSLPQVIRVRARDHPKMATIFLLSFLFVTPPHSTQVKSNWLYYASGRGLAWGSVVWSLVFEGCVFNGCCHFEVVGWHIFI